MIAALLALLACQLLGELLRAALHLPIPGPVIGMFLLAAMLAWQARRKPARAIPAELDRVAERHRRAAVAADGDAPA